MWTGIKMAMSFNGQRFVDCSRVGSLKNIFRLATGGETKNIVYNNVLS